MKKFIFKHHQIKCPRCEYTGPAMLSLVHLILFLLFFSLSLVSLGAELGFWEGPWWLDLLKTRRWSPPVWPTGALLCVLIGSDENVYRCPKCQCTYYDILP